MAKPPTSSALAAQPATVRVVGPFLGYRGRPGAIRVCIGLPHRDEPALRCRLTDDSGQLVREQLCASLHPAGCERATALFRTFVFDFDGLPPGATLAYAFFVDGAVEALDLEGDLRAEHCRFRVPGEIDAESAVVLMSCHNPFTFAQGAAEYGWALWEKLLALIDRDPRIELLILGGDQVYNDDLEDEGFILRLRLKPDGAALHDAVRRRLIRQYQLFWHRLPYRRVLARIPSVAMWDDHDITDGWGGRAESMQKNEFLPGWLRYYELCREAFTAYQSVRNPPQTGCFAALPAPVFTTAFDLGDCRFLLLDLRSEKNSDKKRVLSPEHLAAVRAEIAGTSDAMRRLFVLTPVVPLRTNFDEDRRLGVWAKTWLAFQLQLQRFRWFELAPATSAWLGWLLPLYFFLRVPDGTLWGNVSGLLLGLAGLLYWIVVAALHWAEHFTLLPQLTDDLEDGLSTDTNRPTLVTLIESLVALARAKNVAPIILTGDIHAAGMTEIVHRRGDDIVSIPQVVASPIAHEPMPKAIEGYTTTTSEMELASDAASRLWARNIFYQSKRNFAVIRLKRPADQRPVEFHLEDHELPVAMNLVFRPR